jgi:ribose 5-phosphate isomerase B
MKIFLACDHAAFDAKEAVKAHLRDRVEDLGTHTADSVHYPDFAKKLARAVLQNPDSRGILLCGSGIGVSIVANRFEGIRAALCRDADDAKMSRLHNDANVLCLAGRKSSSGEILKMVDVFLTTEFEGGRHQTRLDLFKGLGSKA